MSLREKLDADIKDAMRARDQVRLDTVRAVKSAVKYKEVEPGASALDEAGIIKVIQSLIKQRQDAAEQFVAGGRTDLADAQKVEIGVLQTYLPQPLSADELEALVRTAITESGATSARDMGAVMKLVQPRAAGRADGRQISELVKRLLAGA